MELSAKSGPWREIVPASRHPSKVELQRFMRGELTRAEARRVVRHLLTGCPACRQTTRRLWGLGERREPEEHRQ